VVHSLAPMTFLVSLKVVRLLLTVSVSFWLAGGCLLACGNMAMAATQRDEEQTAVEAPSCQSAQEHHCCSKPKPAPQSTIDPKLTESFLALTPVPRDSMSECPLAMNATAITAKANSYSPDSAQTTNAALPLAAGNRELPRTHLVAPLVPNRGPTYLRCCVFLI
jgi:hypothetical protein